MKYTPKFRPQFDRDLNRYAGYKARVKKKVLAILEDPYHNTEPLENRPGHNLKGIRSKRIDRNFRILFSVCEECRRLFPRQSAALPCRHCHADLPGTTVIFFAAGPHEKIYKTTKPVG